MTPDEIRGIAIQDQEISQVQSVWNKTHPELQYEFMDLLDVDPDDFIAIIENDEVPEEWILFLQSCALIGLKHSVCWKDD